jgi:hypothetical protein
MVPEVIVYSCVRLHRIPAVVSGVVMFPWAQAHDVLRRYDESLPTMPGELTVQIGVVADASGESVVYLLPAWTGDPAAATPWVDRLTALGTPVLAQVAAMPYSAMLHLMDPFVVWGRHTEVRTRTLRRFGDRAIDVFLDAGDSRTSAFSGIAVHHFHGAATRVPVDATAFGLREPHFMVEILAAWDAHDDATPRRAWADRVYAELEENAVEGGYPILIGPDHGAQAEAAYGPNAGRLSHTKQRYDPYGVFTATSLPSIATIH